MSHTLVRLRRTLDRALRDETGASTAEYAITVLATYLDLRRTPVVLPL